MDQNTLKYGALYISLFLAFTTWALFCYLDPITAPVTDLISIIKIYLISAGSATLALYSGPKDPPPAVPV